MWFQGDPAHRKRFSTQGQNAFGICPSQSGLQAYSTDSGCGTERKQTSRELARDVNELEEEHGLRVGHLRVDTALAIGACAQIARADVAQQAAGPVGQPQARRRAPHPEDARRAAVRQQVALGLPLSAIVYEIRPILEQHQWPILGNLHRLCHYCTEEPVVTRVAGRVPARQALTSPEYRAFRTALHNRDLTTTEDEEPTEALYAMTLCKPAGHQ